MIPMVDLKQQYQTLKHDIDQGVSDVLQNCHFIQGPNVSAFETEAAEYLNVKHAIGCASGTDALQLALLAAGIGPGDEVVVSTLTFAASVNPIVYLGARPLFIDSEPASWNMDPALLAAFLARRARANRLPKAVVVVHLYGQSADLGPILAACRQHGVPLIEDAAEALGATYQGRAPGTFGRAGIFSFNGNKIITTSGGRACATASIIAAVEPTKSASASTSCGHSGCAST